MKNFSRRGNWLDQTTNEIRAIYTFFLVFALIGQITFVMIGVTRIGLSYQKVVEHYRGGGGDGEKGSDGVATKRLVMLSS